MRVHSSGDPRASHFAQQLLQLGEGKMPTDANGMIELKPDFCTVVKSINELQNSVYDNLHQNVRNHEWLCERAILAPTNDCVNKINSEIQNQLPGTSKEYISIDTVTEDEQAVNYPTEFLNSL